MHEFISMTAPSMRVVFIPCLKDGQEFRPAQLLTSWAFYFDTVISRQKSANIRDKLKSISIECNVV